MSEKQAKKTYNVLLIKTYCICTPRPNLGGMGNHYISPHLRLVSLAGKEKWYKAL